MATQQNVIDPWGQPRTVTYGATNPVTGQQFQTASPSQYGLLNQNGAPAKPTDVAGNPLPSNNPVAIPAQNPNVLTAGQAVADVNTNQSSLESQLADIQAQNQSAIEARNRELDEQAKAEELRIRNEYGAKERTLQGNQAEEKDTSRALQFKLGRQATLYADAEKQKLNQAHQNQLNDLTNQMNNLINQSKAAIKNEKFSVARQLQSEANDKFNQILSISREKRERESADLKRMTDDRDFELEVAKFQQSLQKDDKPMIVAPGSSIYNPSTGEFIGTAPERPADNKPIIEKIGNDLVQWNPKLNIWQKVFSGGDGDINTSGQALDWAKLIANGQAKLTDVPSEIRSQVVSALSGLPPDESKIAPLKDKVQEIEQLLTSPGMKGAVGSYGVSRWTPFSPDAGVRQDFIAGVQQLVSQDTLQTLLDLKAQGGTLGALSDQERVMLQSAASKIGTWALRDKDTGEVIGYKISEGLFKKELEKIKGLTQRAIEKAGGNTVESASKAVEDFYLKNPAQREYIERLNVIPNPKTGAPYTDEEKAEILGISFKQVGGDTKLATKAASFEDLSHGGQCGRFVNKLTGLGVGDSFESKMAKMDRSITEPKPGMVFVMPYKNTGHIGIILDVKDGIATVKDSNYRLDEKIRTHQIPISKMTGFKEVNQV